MSQPYASPERLEQSTTPYEFNPETRTCVVRDISDSFPEAVFELGDAIEILHVPSGNYTSLPDGFHKLPNLRIAFFSGHQFGELPQVFGGCDSIDMLGFKSCGVTTFAPEALPETIKGLVFTDNQLREIPESVGRFKHLLKLMLTGNQLETLPGSILGCESLQLLRAASNQFRTLPEHVLELPNLAWYTDSGNPGSYVNPSLVYATNYPYENLEVGSLLGKSSKNTVHQARHGEQTFAAKLFGAGVTTDGLPHDEIAASLTAGPHPSVVGSHGWISRNGELVGMAMPLIPNHFSNLGNPPDFHTLTRDVYDQQSFTPEYTHRIIRDIASALTHLHQRGVMHGDVYAHNILTDENGDAHLADFGAASLYDPQSDAGKQREAVEVKGFGYLVDDLLSRTGMPPYNLQYLRDACLSASPTERPRFADIEL